VFGPFEPMMDSPAVMSQARAMGDYLRYKSAIGNTLSELAILLTAREWTQEDRLRLRHGAVEEQASVDCHI
jgi:4-carboxymuconolactone decarboxylase